MFVSCRDTENTILILFGHSLWTPDLNHRFHISSNYHMVREFWEALEIADNICSKI